MAESTLHLIVRTPHGVILDEHVSSLRVPSDTGQVGLRPRVESSTLVVQPGLALAATASGLQFVATAGGLLRCDGREAVVLTPLAVVGVSPVAVRAELADALEVPSADRELRGALQRLETGILQELRAEAGESARDRGGRFG